MTSRVGMHCYHDCESEEMVLCMTWAHHIVLVTVADGNVVHLDQEAVCKLIGQLQDWLASEPNLS